MTPDEFAWIRENVWTAAMRKTWREVPGATTACACQYGTTLQCQRGDCDRCHRATSLTMPIGYICRRDGETPLVFTQPYKHPHATATQRVVTSLAMVWYADRLCRWLCPCDCHSRQQGALFDLAVTA